MEKHLLKLFRLADKLNERQDKVFAEIHYCADNRKELEICIRTKKDFKYVEEVKMQLKHNSIINWENAVHLFKNYVNGGVGDNE